MAKHGHANVGRYDLTEWLQFRAQVIEQHQRQIRQIQAEAQDQGIENPQLPDPPDIPETPPAFDRNLMPTWDGRFETFAPILRQMTQEAGETHAWMKSIRSPKEELWRNRRMYYDMAEELAFDRNRRKSTNLVEKFQPNAELSPERMALVLPLIFEAVQLLFARSYMTMLGTGDGYVELLGRERNDIPGAKLLEKFMNYQQSHEIPTEDVLADFVLDGYINGTGVLFQDWDPITNRRKQRAVSRFDIWWDLAPSQEEIKVMRYRREVSVGELEDLRNQGKLWFSNADIAAAAEQHIEHERETRSTQTDSDPRASARAQRNIKRDDINRRYRKVFLDIQMDTEPWRWVYVVNESLIIGVSQPLIPEDPDKDVQARFPVTIFAPIRRLRDIDGDSFVSRALDSQDLINASLELLISNLKANALGIGITNDESLQDKPLRAGFWHYSHDPKAIQVINFPDISGSILGLIDWFTTRVMDKISGTNDITRGRAQFSGQTATATRDLLNQATTRLTPMERRALKTMQDVYSVAITLNRLYLQPHKYIRVVGEEAIQHMGALAQAQGRGMESVDFLGVTGQDLVPTGFPGSSSAITQETLNEAAVVAQTGGDPRPLMREYIKIRWKGRVNVDEVYPDNAIGNDPVQENENMLSGIPVSRDPDDIDAWHIQVHRTLETDKRFLDGIEANPMLLLVYQQHVQVHAEAMQQQARLLGGIAPGGGLGGGNGTAGLNTSMVNPRPKSDQERENQVGAERVRASR